MSPNATHPTSVDLFVSHPDFRTPDQQQLEDLARVLGSVVVVSTSEIAPGKFVFRILSNNDVFVTFWLGFADVEMAENLRETFSR